MDHIDTDGDRPVTLPFPQLRPVLAIRNHVPVRCEPLPAADLADIARQVIALAHMQGRAMAEYVHDTGVQRLRIDSLQHRAANMEKNAQAMLLRQRQLDDLVIQLSALCEQGN